MAFVIMTMEFYDSLEADNAHRYLDGLGYDVSLSVQTDYWVNIHVERGDDPSVVAREVAEVLDDAGYKWDWL